jgi:sugar porter (SP) family MFS transporter
LIGGIGVGGSSVLGPMYISEIAPATKRGRMVGTFQLAIVLGIVTAYFSNYLLVNTGENNWRYMFMAEGIPAMAFISALFFVVRSPRWLVKTGKEQEAEQAILKVARGNNRVSIEEIRNSLASEAKAGLAVLFNKRYTGLLIVGILIGMFNQFTGINAVLYYAPDIFKSAGFTDESSLVQTVFIGSTLFLFTVIAMSVIDKLGRKFLLIAGSAGMVFFLTLFSVTYLREQFSGIALLVYLLGFIACFAFSQGTVIWVILSEIFPTSIRAYGTSLGSFSHWLFNFLITFLYPFTAKKLGIGEVFAVFALMTLVSIGFYLIALKETRGKRLEEISTS